MREAEGRGSRPQQAHQLQLLYALNEIRPPRAVLLMPVPSSLKKKDRLRLERYVRLWQHRYVAYHQDSFKNRSEGLGRGTAIPRDIFTAGIQLYSRPLRPASRQCLRNMPHQFNNQRAQPPLAFRIHQWCKTGLIVLRG
ncbi:hypothetical protein Vi05172_g10977 [Venturia inaequalis]|nr:hypothetical protein Vi05172_g10977 [Venturia inaequalis]